MCETKAVSVKNVFFSYFNSHPILNAINLTIERTTICGLLGSSGCGKTTLLKCILGRLKPKAGDIKIFGMTRFSNQCIAATVIGYMPQELGLCFEFTLEEMLTYFGIIYGMKYKEIDEKVQQLLKLLQLPQKRLIASLSGGQKRRVSLACALIHSPPLLILDEPTVGLDPVLRRDIWLYLRTFCMSGHTIIITTHYIEEARNANTVAFMRNGTILAQDNPNALLKRYESTKLEEVFLQLCHSEEELNERTGASNNEVTHNNNNINNNNYSKCETIIEENIELEEVPREILIDCNTLAKQDEKQILSSGLNQKNLVSIRNSSFIGKCFALLYKNFTTITRNPLLLIFELILCSAMFITMFICIGEGPTNMKLAINNEEHTLNLTDSWGQLFVESIDKNVFIFNYYDSYEEAFDSVKRGENHAVIDINEMFTKALILRFLYLKDTDKEILDQSRIRVEIDRSDQLIGFQIEGYLYKAMNTFFKALAKSFKINPNFFKSPLFFEKSLDDERKYSFREFIIPGAYITGAFFSTAMITGTVVIAEQQDGLLERSLLAGIKATEFLISNLISQLIILFFQILILLFFSYILFNIVIKGSIIMFFLLILSQGLCGIAFGLFLAIISPNFIIGSLILSFTYFAGFLTSGVAWPTENMPFVFQMITKIMPNTIAVQSNRDIIYKGWGLDYYEVYMGFIITYVWFTIFLVLGIIFLRRKN